LRKAIEGKKGADFCQRPSLSQVVFTICTVEPARDQATVLEIYGRTGKGKDHFCQASQLDPLCHF